MQSSIGEGQTFILVKPIHHAIMYREGHLLRNFPQLRVVVPFGGGGLREQAFRNVKYERLLN